jgi:asparagine N-glycosylation enzyme membrane subunit Stt3
MFLGGFILALIYPSVIYGFAEGYRKNAQIIYLLSLLIGLLITAFLIADKDRRPYGLGALAGLAVSLLTCGSFCFLGPFHP